MKKVIFTKIWDTGFYHPGNGVARAFPGGRLAHPEVAHPENQNEEKNK